MLGSTRPRRQHRRRPPHGDDRERGCLRRRRDGGDDARGVPRHDARGRDYGRP